MSNPLKKSQYFLECYKAYKDLADKVNELAKKMLGEKPEIKTHFHCWEQEQPPSCGQKIKHLVCCLCDKLNPEAKKRLIHLKPDYKVREVK